jgi:uncharacterized protein
MTMPARPVKRLLVRMAGALAIAAAAFVAVGYRNATSDPIVRTAAVHVANWPKGNPPIRVLLISDIHVAGPDMPPERVVQIAQQLNATKPDLVLIAGDMISEKALATRSYPPSEIVASLAAFKAPLGVIVALGNHDHWADAAAFQRELAKKKLTLLENEAVKRGGLVVGGVGDEFSGHADIPKTYRAMALLDGLPVILTHDPDIIPDLPSPVAAVFAGHTHCGQINRPWSGQPAMNVSRYGMRFQCGDIVDRGQRIFVTAGLGTSVVWLRYGAPPDVWLVTLGP